MNFDFSHLKTRVKEVENWLTKELSQVRAGRASSAILDSVQVDSYGSKMYINQLATIVSEDPRTLRIAPWDMSQVKEIEKAIESFKAFEKKDKIMMAMASNNISFLYFLENDFKSAEQFSDLAI